MKHILVSLLSTLALLNNLEAKPPAPPPKRPETNTITAPPSPPGWLRWLMEQDGSPAAVAAPALEVLQSLTSQPIAALKPAEPADASVVSRISAALDRLLPSLNRAESPVRSAPKLSSVPDLVEDELRTALSTQPELEVSNSANPPEDGSLGSANPRAYPSLRLTDTKSKHVYYLGLAFVPAGRAASTAPALEIDPRVTARRIESGGTPLLVVLEHNAKPGSQLAFLNWQLVDLQNARVRLRLSFASNADDLSQPGSVINDGRKGRD